jgi:hypothetical protein
MIRQVFVTMAVALALQAASTTARAQHLWWDLHGHDDATCVYGEITVLATHSAIYYCGANWHPGEPAGGYCGIQHNGEQERRTIFSIWDTDAHLHPRVTASDPQTIFNRFGGEGTGAHTHMLWDWSVGKTFAFFMEKSRGKEADMTDARYYFFDAKQDKWRFMATINSPNGKKSVAAKSVATIGGGLNSFLENFSGQDRSAPKLALYRLWLGQHVENMKCLTHAHGDGTWGQLGDAYFLAEGGTDELKSTFEKQEQAFGKPTFGGQGMDLKPLADKAMPAAAIAALKNLANLKHPK